MLYIDLLNHHFASETALSKIYVTLIISFKRYSSKQKITYEALSSADMDMDPLKMLEGLANGQGPQCEHFVDNPIYAGEENGFPTVVRLFECHGNKQTGKPLVTMIKVIKGKTALYSITRIWRLEAPAEGEPLPIDQSELAAWSNHLNKAILIRR